MDRSELSKILHQHGQWLVNNEEGRQADLRGADLRRADLRGANLYGADLRGVNLDLGSFPLWCGSFGIIADDRLIWQLIAHLTRLDVSRCSRDAREAVEAAMLYANRFCKYRSDVKELELREALEVTE